MMQVHNLDTKLPCLGYEIKHGTQPSVGHFMLKMYYDIRLCCVGRSQSKNFGLCCSVLTVVVCVMWMF